MVVRAHSETASDDVASNLGRVCENSFRLLEGLIPKIGAAAAGADPDIQKAS